MNYTSVVLNRLKLQKVEPIYIILTLHTFVCLLAVNLSAFSRTYTQLFFATFGVIFFEFIFRYSLKLRQKLTLAGLVSSYGIFFLLDTNYTHLFLLAAFLTVGFKYLVQFQNKHIFNPTNLSLMVVALLFSDIATLNTFRWEGSLFWSLYFIMSGLFLSFFAKRILMSLSFILGFITVAAFRSLVFDLNFKALLLPLASPALYLFTFFMMTDPKTTPESARKQLMFGFLVALIDGMLRQAQFRLAPQMSLLVITAIFFLIEYKKTFELKIV